jgi:hypothetical protein
MGFFDLIGDMMEEHEEREEWEERREEYYEEEAWGMEGMYFDPYRHGELYYDPALGHHGVMYDGRWHPLDYRDGAWVFAHPRHFGVPRNYRPRDLMPPRQAGFGGFGQGVPASYGRQPTTNTAVSAPSRAVAARPGSLLCARCHATLPYGTCLCQACGTEPAAPAIASNAVTHCASCGAQSVANAYACGACGRPQV